MTLLKAANVLFFQWFFVRLTKCTEKKVEDYKLLSYDLMPDGNISSRGVGSSSTYQWYSIQYCILPCSGWWNDFVYLNKKPKFIRCTEPKKI